MSEFVSINPEDVAQQTAEETEAVLREGLSDEFTEEQIKGSLAEHEEVLKQQLEAPFLEVASEAVLYEFLVQDDGQVFSRFENGDWIPWREDLSGQFEFQPLRVEPDARGKEYGGSIQACINEKTTEKGLVYTFASQTYINPENKAIADEGESRVGVEESETNHQEIISKPQKENRLFEQLFQSFTATEAQEVILTKDNTGEIQAQWGEQGLSEVFASEVQVVRSEDSQIQSWQETLSELTEAETGTVVAIEGVRDPLTQEVQDYWRAEKTVTGIQLTFQEVTSPAAPQLSAEQSSASTEWLTSEAEVQQSAVEASSSGGQILEQGVQAPVATASVDRSRPLAPRVIDLSPLIQNEKMPDTNQVHVVEPVTSTSQSEVTAVVERQAVTQSEVAPVEIANPMPEATLETAQPSHLNEVSTLRPQTAASESTHILREPVLSQGVAIDIHPSIQERSGTSKIEGVTTTREVISVSSKAPSEVDRVITHEEVVPTAVKLSSEQVQTLTNESPQSLKSTSAAEMTMPVKGSEISEASTITTAHQTPNVTLIKTPEVSAINSVTATGEVKVSESISVASEALDTTPRSKVQLPGKQLETQASTIVQPSPKIEQVTVVTPRVQTPPVRSGHRPSPRPSSWRRPPVPTRFQTTTRPPAVEVRVQPSTSQTMVDGDDQSVTTNPQQSKRTRVVPKLRHLAA